MITTDEARELLGDDADDMTDAEVDEAHRFAEHLAFVIARMFQERQVQ